MKLTIVVLILLCTLLVVDKSYKEPYYSERDALAAIIHAECGNCSEMDLYLTGSVVLNRTLEPNYPNTIRGVIRQPNQFHGYLTSQYIPTKKTKKVADDLLKGVFHVPCLIYFCTKDSRRPMNTVLIEGKSHLYGD